MKTTFIYALKELAPGEFQSSTIRYVGKADDPYKRFEQHLGCREKSHLGNWIRGLPATGGSLQLEVLDEVPDSQWQFWEREYIRVFRAIGFKLVNGTDGGEGLCNPSQEVRLRMGRSQRGRRQAVETREKIAAYQRGRKKSPRSVAKTAAAHVDRKRPSNKSGFAGVHWNTQARKWVAVAPVSAGGTGYLGLFLTAKEAAAARLTAMKAYYGA